MRTLDPPRFYCGRRRFREFELLLDCHVTLIGFRFRQVHSSFATFVVPPTQRGNVYWRILILAIFWYVHLTDVNFGGYGL